MDLKLTEFKADHPVLGRVVPVGFSAGVLSIGGLALDEARLVLLTVEKMTARLADRPEAKAAAKEEPKAEPKNEPAAEAPKRGPGRPKKDAAPAPAPKDDALDDDDDLGAPTVGLAFKSEADIPEAFRDGKLSDCIRCVVQMGAGDEASALSAILAMQPHHARLKTFDTELVKKKFGEMWPKLAPNGATP